MSKDFVLRFEEGRITEVHELDDPDSAMATGKLKVNGKQTVLLRHMKKFAYMINKMTQIEASYA